MFPRHKTSTATPRHTPVIRIALLVLSLLAGLTAATVTQVGPAGATTVPTRSAMEIRIDWSIFHLINKERAAHGLSPLTMAWHLRQSSRHHNVTMARFNEMSHQLPGEPVFTTRILNAGYHWSWAGENIAWNSDISLPGVKLLQRLMYREKPPDDAHRLNILSTHYRNIGVDVYVDKAHGKIWLTTDFAKPMG